MKRLIPLLVAALSLSGCLKEDTWCPVMNVSFEMEDEFLEGDYDSRIKNDVLLYIFNDDMLVYTRTIPYEAIAGGAEFAIPKTPELLGDLKLVAWAVKSNESDRFHEGEPLTVHHDERHPRYDLRSRFDEHYMTMSKLEGAEHYTPAHPERYIGTLDPIENELWDRHSHHDITLHPAPGRIIVNIKDPNGLLGSKGDAHVVVEGGMSHMELGEPDQGRVGRHGFGERATVRANVDQTPATRAEGDPTHTTGMFGVMPSEANAPLKVHIMNGDERVKTLSISADNMGEKNFTAIRSGDLIQFDYDVVSTELTVTIGAFVKRIIVADL